MGGGTDGIRNLWGDEMFCALIMVGPQQVHKTIKTHPTCLMGAVHGLCIIPQ